MRELRAVRGREAMCGWRAVRGGCEGREGRRGV